jgi:hypothetical protein
VYVHVYRLDWPRSGPRTWQTGFAHEPDPMFRFRFVHLAGPNIHWGPGSTPCMNLDLRFVPEPFQFHTLGGQTLYNTVSQTWCWICNPSTWHCDHKKWTLGCVPASSPRPGSSVEERLGLCQEAWVQTPVRPSFAATGYGPCVTCQRL